jgi:hypothetical protein
LAQMNENLNKLLKVLPFGKWFYINSYRGLYDQC